MTRRIAGQNDRMFPEPFQPDDAARLPALPATDDDPAGTLVVTPVAPVPSAESRPRTGRALRRWIGLIITIGLFAAMAKPIVQRWHDVRGRIAETSPLRFVIAAGMFALFLFIIRVVSWRRIIRGFGRKLPYPAAARIWSTSELARYLPGAIWQVFGRVYLVAPYGVDAATSSASQVLELTIFLLANIFVALACLPSFAGVALFQGAPAADQRLAWIALATISALSPLLLLLLRPRTFYGIINRVLTRMGRAPIAHGPGGGVLLGLTFWAILGLCWQGIAIWILIGQPQALNLGFGRIGLMIGAYCLAWCAGFLAFWAPAGLGIREVVLMTALRFALPPQVLQHLGDPQSVRGFLAFLAVLLRLWTIAGELILTSAAYVLDHRGALGLANAAGRIGPPPRRGLATGTASSANS
jgi:hypothetical protein